MLDSRSAPHVRLRERASTATRARCERWSPNTPRTPVEAKKCYDKLQHVIDAYVSPEWTTAAIARQGSLYDSLRTGLYNTRRRS